MKSKNVRQVVITLVPAMTVLMIVACASVVSCVNIASFTADVTSTANMHPLTGVISSLGIVLWGAAGSISLYTAIILRGIEDAKIYWFLLNSSLLSLCLMLDDAFSFHEVLAHKYFGIHEEVIYAVLGIFVLAYLITFRRIIVNTRFYVLILALGFLSLSVIVDATQERWMRRLGQWEYLLEDGAKWLGIAIWCSYYVQTSYAFMIKGDGLPARAHSQDGATPRQH